MDDAIALDKQLCFALYSAARATQAAYRGVLDDLDLTYPQWLVLLALWGEDGLAVGQLGERLHLDSGTLSPLLRRLEARGVVSRRREDSDGRKVLIFLTDDGQRLRERVPEVQERLRAAVNLSDDEIVALRHMAQRLVTHQSTGVRP